MQIFATHVSLVVGGLNQPSCALRRSCSSEVSLFSMSVRRALVDGAVLSLRDSCVFYPCCKSCFSRIDTEQLDAATRCRCSRCGSRCLRDQVDYRYRLSLRVTRDSYIFDVTVFGNSLNAYFGIHATGLQKLVVNQEGPVEPSIKSRLLVKAVRDCFIGRHFIFGIKLTGTESGPWFGGPGSDDSSRKEAAQFVASQMILPKASGLSGCTVLSYYQILLQKASDYEEGSADPAAPLVLDPGTSDSFSNALLSQSQLRLQNPDLSLTPTALWEQSLGIVTSSAEQEEEGCSTQDGRQVEKSITPHFELKKHKVTEERTSLFPSEQSFYNNPFVTDLYFGATVGSNFSVKSCFSPFQPVHRSDGVTQKQLSTSQLTRSISSSSSAWEDLPFSESLTEFLHKQDKDFEVQGEMKTSLNVQNKKQTIRTPMESPNRAVRWTSACQRNRLVRASPSLILSDISNTPAAGGGDRPDLSVQEYNRPEETHVYSHESDSENDKSFLTFEEKEEQLEEDSYNCSADLFSDPLRCSRNEENADAEAVRWTAGVCLSEQQRPRDETGTQLTPQKLLQISKCSRRDSLTLNGTDYFDFIPPSQSTPVVKLTVTQSLSMSHRNTTGEFAKQMLAWSRRSNRCSNRPAAGSRFRKAEKHKQLQVGQDESTRTINYEHGSRVRQVSVCDFEDDEGIVAPTPVGKRQRAASRRRRGTAGVSSDLGLIRKTYQGNGVDQTLTSPRHEAQTTNYKKETVDEASLEGLINASDDSDQSRDWSRDLFSDSVFQ